MLMSAKRYGQLKRRRRRAKRRLRSRMVGLIVLRAHFQSGVLSGWLKILESQ